MILEDSWSQNSPGVPSSLHISVQHRLTSIQEQLGK